MNNQYKSSLMVHYKQPWASWISPGLWYLKYLNNEASPGLGSNTYLYLYLYLNTQISVFVFVFVFENPQDEIFVFVFVFDWRIWVYLKNIFQIHFSFLHFDT